ncbi:alpha-galactosidase [Polymorphobacter fuscus]|uniref:Alpha-galactosidase n=1 Tax=Sandarakinorhabdus fusca TaxID=1439888 RepID=A0A7C9KY81_9SPHN|nr:alpha-galactosidase [Polymorphobacter fuscus]KAB7644880.1 alpha-galactosidase [Polymorphobacter fuscus]MQT18162.1 alpha-galactosidase [Polymorphobacter fuscus]NJC09480.1 alpha-galactosidase [Polymorphobacter fuscus]
MQARLIRGVLLAGLCLSPLASASAESAYDAGTRVFRLDGGDVTYAFKVDGQGLLQSVYWGARLANGDPVDSPAIKGLSGFDVAANVVPQEHAGWGGGLFAEAALKIAFPDGNRDLVLVYAAHRLERDGVTVQLRDISRPVNVTLRYTIDRDTGIVGRSATIVNGTAGDIRVDQAMSGTYVLPVGRDYQLNFLTGRWGAEWTRQQRPVSAGATVLESRRGSTGSENNPFFAISRAGATTEADGPVWFGALAWSGSHRITVDQDVAGRVRVTGGYNPFDFAYRLGAGEKLETPIFYAGHTGRGMGEASRLFHRFQRDTILPHAADKAPALRKILYNSWEATEFKVDEAGQVALAGKAAKIGVERFVMDDGWFGARNNDKAGLGDWTVNRQKFPNGLKPLISRVNALGMEFGLWVEPEMVNADSDLYRAHPDWVIAFDGRPRTEGRNQMVLNLAKPEVRDHLLKVLDELLTTNRIAFLKWDYNRNWSEPGWLGAAPADQQRIWVDYVRNLYGILAELRRRHPGVEIESCSGGGGRVDLGIMGLTDQVWASDNTDPVDRLLIQDGFTQAYAPGTMMAWVTDSPNWLNKRSTPLSFRFLSAMQGGLGIGTNLNHWVAEDFATASTYVAAYKRIRATVQRGDLYRLVRPTPGDVESTTLYVAADKSQAALFTLVQGTHRLDPRTPIRLQGLDPAARYRIERMDGAALPEGVPAVASGAYWMGRGLDVPLRGDFQGAGFILTRGS